MSVEEASETIQQLASDGMSALDRLLIDRSTEVNAILMRALGRGQLLLAQEDHPNPSDSMPVVAVEEAPIQAAQDADSEEKTKVALAAEQEDK